MRRYQSCEGCYKDLIGYSDSFENIEDFDELENKRVLDDEFDFESN